VERALTLTDAASESTNPFVNPAVAASMPGRGGVIVAADAVDGDAVALYMSGPQGPFTLVRRHNNMDTAVTLTAAELCVDAWNPLLRDLEDAQAAGEGAVPRTRAVGLPVGRSTRAKVDGDNLDNELRDGEEPTTCLFTGSPDLKFVVSRC
jgi:hypothetical protein